MARLDTLNFSDIFPFRGTNQALFRLFTCLWKHIHRQAFCHIYFFFFSCSLNRVDIVSLPFLVPRSSILISPLNTNSIIPMYASPSAAVITPAVPADIAPPTTVPAPGINFNKLVTTVFPRKLCRIDSRLRYTE